MAELVKQILSLSKAERLKIAMQILLSIQDEDEAKDLHVKELSAFQKDLKEDKVTYFSEEEFWAEARKRVSSTM